MKEQWSDLSYKDKASYIVAFTMITSGMLIAFLSFFLNEHNIEIPFPQRDIYIKNYNNEQTTEKS